MRQLIASSVVYPLQLVAIVGRPIAIASAIGRPLDQRGKKGTALATEAGGNTQGKEALP